MKVSRAWLQNYFDTELPSSEKLADALTFHAFEIEGIEGDMLDVKVLPDRACYALSHRGIAKEISAILDIPLKRDPLREELPAHPATGEVSLTIDTPKCSRHMAALVRGVKVGPSPEWLRRALLAVGARSINNIVDATNYVTLDMGQPIHAFDAGKIPSHAISVRETFEGESVTLLTGETHVLPEGTMVLSEGRDGVPLDVAGVKGGLASMTTEASTDLLVSVANFDGTSIRRTAQALKLWTDASLRFQNRPSPELVAYGMRDVLALITKVAGGEVVGVAECYPNPEGTPLPVPITVATINAKLGSSFSEKDVTGVFTRLGFSYAKEGDVLAVTPLFERGDIRIPEDLVEEVGRIMGYDAIPATELPVVENVEQRMYRGIERVKDILVSQGFTEISTPSFAEKGEVLLSNPLQEDKPYLRPNLSGNMEEALTRAGNVAPRVLGPTKDVRLFEVGNVFTKSGEVLSLSFGVKALSGKSTVLADAIAAIKELTGIEAKVNGNIAEMDLGAAKLAALGEGYKLSLTSLGTFEPFSAYPFALRDVAVWTPEGTQAEDVATRIRAAAGPLLARLDLFDSFSKDGRTSYAFRLVLEAADRTLGESELNEVMGKVTDALSATQGYDVR